MIFNEKEKRGIIVVLFILMTMAVIISLRKCKFSSPDARLLSGRELETIELLELKNKYKDNKSKKDEDKNNRDKYNEYTAKEIVYSAFDPNNVTQNRLKEMGLNKIAVSNWIKYLKKGGRFYKKEDIRKIYGLSPEAYRALSPYMVLSKPEKVSKTSDTAAYKKSEYTSYERKKKREKPMIDINISDSLELTELRGIGQKLSARIVKYRDRLGGFVRTEQLKEVYGLPPETYESIKDQIIVDPKMIKKLRINLADEYILSGFPYISKREAYQIVNYRKQHGKFRNTDDLRKIKSLDEEFMLKIEPYLDFGE